MTLAVPSHSFWRVFYAFLILPMALVLVHVAALARPKLRASLRGRRGLWERLKAQAGARDPSRPLVWIHAASAGEILMALPVLERLLAGGAQGALTVTSVSGLRWVERQRERLPGLIVADYLPLDTRGHARRMLALLRPAALVYVKYDLWPNLIWAARAAGVRQYLLAATLHEGSRRLASPLSRSFYRALYPALDALWPVAESHAERFRAAVPDHPAVLTLGDPRFDSVLERQAREGTPGLSGTGLSGAGLSGIGLSGTGLSGEESGARIFVAGSTWPDDESRIVPALREALALYPELRVVIAPHECSLEHVRGIEDAFEGFPLLHWSALAGGPAVPAGGPAGSTGWRVLLVDEVGPLFSLYALADLAYVGGGFGEGVHNVLEPCAQGAAAMFGPRHGNDPAAEEMVEGGVGWTFEDAAEFRERLLPLLEDPARCEALGNQARAFVQERAGAAERAAERIAVGWA